MGGGVNDITTIGAQALQVLANMENAEQEMLQLPQVNCPVVHYFGPNICIREVFMPAGTLAIGHKQKFEHMNIMLRGKVMVVDDAGATQILSAPLIFVGKPGRKIGYVLEDMVWQNVYSTDLKDIDAVESTFLEKSENWQDDQAAKFKVAQIERVADRADYEALLQDCGISDKTARQQSEDESDQVWLDIGNVRVTESPIEGKGLFATAPIFEGSVICPARVNGLRTQAGRYTNHSVNPNAVMVPTDMGDINLVALRDIEGCVGGGLGEEITIDYRAALQLSGIEFNRQEALCQP
jgi:hypothetical protein